MRKVNVEPGKYTEIVYFNDFKSNDMLELQKSLVIPSFFPYHHGRGINLKFTFTYVGYKNDFNFDFLKQIAPYL